jgi:hypothetical protein
MKSMLILYALEDIDGIMIAFILMEIPFMMTIMALESRMQVWFP